MVQSVFQRAVGLIQLLWREVAKFGVVGGLGWVIDNGLFFILAHGILSDGTIKARVVSSSIAILFSWFANRYWTFRHRRGNKPWREFFLFIVMSLMGLGIAVGCQYISRYVLGFQTVTADFIAGGVIGLILGTIFRFLTYRFFVFTEELDAEPEYAGDHALVEAPQKKASATQPERNPVS
ncbi:hypothetical protein UM93_00565 [Psychromicrobium lacuslunae]|uniref:GtrA/DPMS transmembrane domain-containing protein n=1 Tax=Psychromicrobium lacuslunae TaxID=1618207 RepID=A0A0D4BWA6_9MICC|nr:hypothetical protein UM93_00565 [Psychromicrobium lacuslunae]